MPELQTTLKLTNVTIGASETEHVLNAECIGFCLVTDSTDATVAFATSGDAVKLYHIDDLNLLTSRPFYGMKGKSIYLDGTQNDVVSVLENIGLF